MKKVKKPSKEKKPSKAIPVLSDKNKEDLQKFLEQDQDTIDDALNLINKVGATCISTTTDPESFSIGIDLDMIEKERANFLKLKDLDNKDVFTLVGSLFYCIHLSEKGDKKIENRLDPINLENKLELFNNVVEKTKSHKAYTEILYILEPFGQRLNYIKGRKLSVEKNAVVMRIYEINLSYYDFDSENKSISLEFSYTQLKKLISDLQELLGE